MYDDVRNLFFFFFSVAECKTNAFFDICRYNIFSRSCRVVPAQNETKVTFTRPVNNMCDPERKVVSHKLRFPLIIYVMSRIPSQCAVRSKFDSVLRLVFRLRFTAHHCLKNDKLKSLAASSHPTTSGKRFLPPPSTPVNSGTT